MKTLSLFFVFLFIALPAFAEFQIDLGYQNHDGNWDTQNTEFDALDTSDSGYHLGVSLRNRVGKSGKHLVGVGLNIDEILEERLIGFRAIDYRYELNESFRVGAFIGAANLDTGFQQSGFYFGANAAYFFTDNIGINIEANYGDKLARDRQAGLDDPQAIPDEGDSPRADIFLDYYSTSVSLSFRF